MNSLFQFNQRIFWFRHTKFLSPVPSHEDFLLQNTTVHQPTNFLWLFCKTIRWTSFTYNASNTRNFNDKFHFHSAYGSTFPIRQNEFPISTHEFSVFRHTKTFLFAKYYCSWTNQFFMVPLQNKRMQNVPMTPALCTTPPWFWHQNTFLYAFFHYFVPQKPISSLFDQRKLRSLLLVPQNLH